MRKTWALAALLPCLVAAALLVRAYWPAAPAPAPAQELRPPAPPEPPLYAGTQACAQCHEQRVAGFQEPAHALTSREPRPDNLSGSFSAGKNVLRTSNPNLWFEMHARDDGFYQDTLMSTPEGPRSAGSQRIDIVTGSGKKGESYLA